eukprot:gene3705-22660_t
MPTALSLLPLLAANAAAATCTAGTCACTKGMNNAGALLRQAANVTDAAACCAMCQSDAKCAGYTYVDTAVCYLHSVWSGAYADAHAVASGLRAPAPAPKCIEKCTVDADCATGCPGS